MEGVPVQALQVAPQGAQDQAGFHHRIVGAVKAAHYLAPCLHGPAEIEVDVLKQGRSLATASARLIQEGRIRLTVLASYGDLRSHSGPTLIIATPPDLPPPDQCGFTGDRPVGDGLPRPAIADQVEFRPSPSTAAALVTRGSPAHLEGWIRLTDGHLDVACLPLLVDAAPPAVFAAMATGWVPTLELTVHVRAEPAPGWLRAAITTRVLVNGLLEEECTLWDDGGQIVAMSRQLARMLPPPP